MINLTSNRITLGSGTYEMSHIQKDIESDEEYARITLTRVEGGYYCVPEFTFWERIKFLFYGELKNVKVYDEGKYWELKNDRKED